MNIKDLQHKTGDSGFGEYDSIPIFAAPNIHESAFACFSETKLPHSASILVLGSGGGAFDKRLLNHGYTNITSVDLIKENYKVTGTTFKEFDLNTDFSVLGTFDAIIALEVIEHIENQFHFMRCVKKMLKPHGALYLSTPNVESTFSRAKFYFFGRLHFFSKEELYGTGHITPVFKHILEFNLSQAGLRIEKRFTNGNVWENVAHGRNLVLKTVYGVFFLLSLLTRNRDTFDIAMYKIVSQ
jgi:2-polyprenyl-3-methyl-5-hydroxy-6-metoxy-1,4-benzoquinol methylase